MIRSNCKKAIENIRNYIMENTDFSNYGMETPTEWKETAQKIMHIFYEEKVKYDNRRMPYQQLFDEWCSGLPSVLNTLYYYNRSAVADVAEILEETEAEANKYTETEAERLLTYLIWREIYKACNYRVM